MSDQVTFKLFKWKNSEGKDLQVPVEESKVQGFTEVFEAEGKEFTIEDYIERKKCILYTNPFTDLDGLIVYGKFPSNRLIRKKDDYMKIKNGFFLTNTLQRSLLSCL